MFPRLLLSPNASAAGGGAGSSTPPTTEPTPQTGGEPGSSANGDGKGGTPAAGSGDEKKPESSFTQADVDRIVKERLGEQKRKLEQDAAEAKAKEQGQWKELADQRETRVKELEPLAEQATRYRDLLNQHLEAQIAGWPDEVKALDPGKDKLDERLAWVEKSKALAERLKAAPTAPSTEAGAGNRPSRAGEGKGDDGSKTTNYRFQRAGDVSW